MRIENFRLGNRSPVRVLEAISKIEKWVEVKDGAG